jgi:hypothetical protein
MVVEELVNFGPTVPLCALRLVLLLCPLCSDCEALKGLHNRKSSVHCALRARPQSPACGPSSAAAS